LRSTGEITAPTNHPQIRLFVSHKIAKDSVMRKLDLLRRYIEDRDAPSVLACLQELIPEYSPSRFVLQGTRQGSSVVTC
jgi:hypothetical protein